MKLVSNLMKNKKNVAQNLAIGFVLSIITLPFTGVVWAIFQVNIWGVPLIVTLLVGTPLFAMLNLAAPLKKLNWKPLPQKGNLDQIYARLEEQRKYSCDVVNNPAFHNMSGNIYNHHTSKR